MPQKLFYRREWIYGIEIYLLTRENGPSDSRCHGSVAGDLQRGSLNAALVGDIRFKQRLRLRNHGKHFLTVSSSAQKRQQICQTFRQPQVPAGYGGEINEILQFLIAAAYIQLDEHQRYRRGMTQTELKKILAETGMGLMAWYLLGHGDKSLREEPVFTELAKKYGKTNAQIILRWHIQSGNVVIPGSKNPDHIRDNFDIFDFVLSDEEMAQIAKVNKNKRYYTATPEMLAGYAKMELGPDL